jgi:hypothetical protein
MDYPKFLERYAEIKASVAVNQETGELVPDVRRLHAAAKSLSEFLCLPFGPMDFVRLRESYDIEQVMATLQEVAEFQKKINATLCTLTTAVQHTAFNSQA